MGRRSAAAVAVVAATEYAQGGAAADVVPDAAPDAALDAVPEAAAEAADAVPGRETPGYGFPAFLKPRGIGAILADAHSAGIHQGEVDWHVAQAEADAASPPAAVPADTSAADIVTPPKQKRRPVRAHTMTVGALEDDVPIPAAGRVRLVDAIEFGRFFAVGQSRLVDASLSGVAGAIKVWTEANSDRGWEFTCREVAGGVRVWRVK